MASDDIKERVSRFKTSKALVDAVVLLELIAQGEKDIQEGRVMPQEEVFAQVRSRLKGIRR